MFLSFFKAINYFINLDFDEQNQAFNHFFFAAVLIAVIYKLFYVSGFYLYEWNWIKQKNSKNISKKFKLYYN